MLINIYFITTARGGHWSRTRQIVGNQKILQDDFSGLPTRNVYLATFRFLPMSPRFRAIGGEFDLYEGQLMEFRNSGDVPD